MSSFKEAAVSSQPDPFKRVKYSLGLVLGVDEFEQEQAYHVESNRRHNRSLHGYGTVCGLQVTSDALEVRVEAGLAVSPMGKEIRVPKAQCARLDEWLAVGEHRAALEESSPPSSPPGSYSVYVNLCYLECESDHAPIPGTPCRTEDESLAPSRITESFDLHFSVGPPDQTEEEAVRAFGRLLERLEVSSDEDDSPIGPADMEEEVRALLNQFGSGDGSPPVEASPPSEPGVPLYVRPAEVDDVLDAALRVWVTEVRPALLADGKNCACGPPDEDCVLLARIDFDADANWVVDPESLRVDEADRPFLLHTRLLSELLRHLSEGVTDHGRLTGLEDDDHPQYLLVDPTTRALIQDLDAGGHGVANLRPGAAAGEAVIFEQAVKVGDAAGGELAGTYPNPTLARLLGSPLVDDPAKLGGWVLTWTGSQWRPSAPTGGGGGGIELVDVVRELPVAPLVTVTRVPRRVNEEFPDRHFPTFEFWFHLNVDAVARANLPRLLSKEDDAEFRFRVFAETDRATPQASPFLTPIQVIDVRPKPGTRNVFEVTLEERVDLHERLRFVFRPSELTLETGDGDRMSLADWALKRPMKWVGHDGGETVHAFYQNDVRQKVIASGTIGPEGSILVSNNLDLPTERPELRVPADYIHWDGYDQRKWMRYMVKGTPFWVDPRDDFLRIPLRFRVLRWEKTGVFVVSEAYNTNEQIPLIGTMLEISEVL